MIQFSNLILFSALFLFALAVDPGPTGGAPPTDPPVTGNSTGNESQPNPKVKPVIDIHKVAYFNLTDWIQDWPNEEAELQQWNLHLVTESGKLYKQMINSRKIRNEMTVANYEEMDDPPIQVEKMEKLSVKEHQMIYHKGNVRHEIFKHYKDKNLYYSFEVFYEDMPSAQIFVETENATADFYDWGTMYNQSTYGNQTVIQKYQIYLRKWMTPEDAYITPNSVFIKEYTYNVTLKEVCVEREYYYWHTHTECNMEVDNIKDAHVLHFLNTGRLHKCSCNCGFTDVEAPIFEPYVRKAGYTTTTTEKPTTAGQTTMGSTTTTGSPTVSTTLAPAQSSTSNTGTTLSASQETTTQGATSPCNKVTTTVAPASVSTTSVPTTTTPVEEDEVLKGKKFRAEIWSTYVLKNSRQYDTYGNKYYFTITLTNSSESGTDLKKKSPIDLETLETEPANIRQVKFNHKADIDKNSVNELHGNAHAAIGFSKTTEPMFLVDFEDGNGTANYHAVEIYLNVTEAKTGSLYQDKYKYHVEMLKVSILDHVSPTTTKSQPKAVFIAKLSFFSNCEDNQCHSDDTTVEFFTNVGIAPEPSLAVQHFVVIGCLAVLAVLAVVGFTYFCCAKKNKKAPSRPPSVQFNGEGVHLVNNLENPNFEDGNPGLDVVNPVHDLENPAQVVENPVNDVEHQIPDDESPIYGLLNPVHGADSPA